MSSPIAEAAGSPVSGATARTGRAVSTWSLHRTLGSFYADDPVGGDRTATRGAAAPTSGLPLLELPAELARRGYDTVQICHFHLPTRAAGYLDELRSSLHDAGVTLDAVLVDDGDLVHPQDADAHQAWIDGWLDDAAVLGARRARLIAGKQPPTSERLRDSSRRLVQLAKDHPEIRVVTENWLALLPTAADVHAVLDPADGAVGFLIDLGNWTGADKYDELAAVAPLAETCHSKCRFDATGPDAADYRHSLQVLRDAGYAGPLALIYDGPDDDEWAALNREHEITHEVFG
jgi:sugar phosphate isomerase/epimerase